MDHHSLVQRASQKPYLDLGRSRKSKSPSRGQVLRKKEMLFYIGNGLFVRYCGMMSKPLFCLLFKSRIRSSHLDFLGGWGPGEAFLDRVHAIRKGYDRSFQAVLSKITAIESSLHILEKEMASISRISRPASWYPGRYVTWWCF